MKNSTLQKLKFLKKFFEQNEKKNVLVVKKLKTNIICIGKVSEFFPAEFHLFRKKARIIIENCPHSAKHNLTNNARKFCQDWFQLALRCRIKT